MNCFATDGFPEVILRCVDMVSDGFQRGFRGSETPDSYMRSEMSVCFVLHWGSRCHFAWFKSALTTCLTGLEMVSQGFQTGFRESSELFQIDVKGVLNSGCFYLV